MQAPFRPTFHASRVIREVTLLRLRALLAQAHGNEAAHRVYRAMVTSLGFEGHMKWAEAMP